MSDYLAIYSMHQDEALLGRITAAAALDGITWPAAWVARRRWQLVARTDWAQAWTYALANDTENPGADPTVITDQMILSSIQEENGRGNA